MFDLFVDGQLCASFLTARHAKVYAALEFDCGHVLSVQARAESPPSDPDWLELGGES